MKKTYIFFVMLMLIACIGTASAKSDTIVDMSNKHVSASQYNIINNDVHFDKNIKDISHFKVEKSKRSHSVKIELTDEYAESSSQTVGISIDDLPGFVDTVSIQHFNNDGINDYTQIVKPVVIDNIAYMDIKLSSVTITPYVNIVKNNGFESWSTSTLPEDWINESSTGGNQSTTSMSGYSYCITGGTSGVHGWIKQPTTTITPGYYTVGAWVRTTNIGSSYVVINLEDGTPSISSQGVGVAGNANWTWYEHREYINSTNPNLNMYMYCPSQSTAQAWIDDLVLSPDYSYSASETSDTTHLYQRFTYTPTAINDPAQFITWFETTTISSHLNPSSTVTVDGNTVESRINGDQVIFDVSGLSATSHNVVVTVTFTPSLNANFTANVTAAVAGHPIQFTDTSTGSPTSWLWDFGDGTTSTSQNPIHAYATNGTKTVTLTAKNDYYTDLETKSGYITIVYTAPTADFTFMKTGPNTFQFTDTSTDGPTYWSWTFGENFAVYDAQNPTYTYKQNGTYEVILFVQNPAGSNYTRKYVTVSAQNGYSEITSISNDQLVMVAVNESHSFNFTSNITLDHTTFYIDGIPQNVSGNELSYTFTEGGLYHNVSAIGYSGDSIPSNKVTWRVQVKREMATPDQKQIELNNSSYNKFMKNFTKFDTMNMTESAVDPFTDLLGRSFYLILFVMPFVLLWQKQQRMTIPTVMALITGALFIGFVPEQYTNFIVYAVILSFTVNLYLISKERM